MQTSTSSPIIEPEDKQRIRDQALAEGFDEIGFTISDIGEEPGKRLNEFILSERHGDMDWIVEKADRRRHPNTLWPEVKSVIVLGQNYGPEENPLANLKRSEIGSVSVYARGKDYHDTVKKRLKRLARWLIATYGGDVKVFVDTAPVMEKVLAQKAGLGWQGKHTNLLSRDFGSWLFIGSIFTTLEIPADEPIQGDCGSCRACLDICPTNAFPAPYQLDARRCISYLTIETRRHIDRELRPLIGNRIYGCDDCLAVCPWNKYAQQAQEMTLRPRPELMAPRLLELVALDDTAFRAFFSGSPVKRLGRHRFIRNVLIAMGNSGDETNLDAILPRLEDTSAIVRLAAVWALGQLASHERYGQIKDDLMHRDQDVDVVAEWNLSKGRL